MKPGHLTRYVGNQRPHFCQVNTLRQINNSVPWGERMLVTNIPGYDVLMFVESLALSRATQLSTATATATAMGTATAMVTATATATVTAMVTAKKEFEETGEIQGGVFLTGGGRQIWISHYDQEAMDLVSNKCLSE